MVLRVALAGHYRNKGTGEAQRGIDMKNVLKCISPAIAVIFVMSAASTPVSGA